MAKKKSTQDAPKVNLTILSRRQRRALGVPHGVTFDDIEKVIEITEKPMYVRYNNGKLTASDVSGADSIAYLYKNKEGTICGWSV